jgi:pseudoazurin
MRILVAATLALLSLSGPAFAETHLVKMLNRNETGGMVYEPDYLEIAPGDTVKFLKTSIGHNAATIDGFLPAGAKPFKGKINEEIEVTFTEAGFYGVKCTPHYDMGMVMLIQVGEEKPSSVVLPDGMPKDSTARFKKIVERAEASR